MSLMKIFYLFIGFFLLNFMLLFFKFEFYLNENEDKTTVADDPYKLYLKPLPCESNQEFFVYVFTRPESYYRRILIRDTWANSTLFGNTKTIFILGLAKSKKANILLMKESETFGDLIQGNFIDAYRNLSYKSIMAWKWTLNYCPQAEYIIKIDDDVVLHSFNFINYIKGLTETEKNKMENSFYCNAYMHSHVERNESSKYYIPKDILPNRTFYDPFCHGVGILMKKKLVENLYEASKKHENFILDDVNVGMIGKLANAQFSHKPDMYLRGDLLARVVINNGFFKDKKNTLFYYKLESNDHFSTLWNAIYKNHSNDFNLK